MNGTEERVGDLEDSTTETVWFALREKKLERKNE